MTSGQQHTGNITSGQFGRTVRNSCLCNKKNKTTPPHKKIEFLLPHTFGTFAFAADTQVNTEAKAKEPNHHPSNSFTFEK